MLTRLIDNEMLTRSIDNEMLIRSINNKKMLIKSLINIIIDFYKSIKSREWFIDSEITRYITFYKNLFIKLFDHNEMIEFENKSELSTMSKNIIRVFINKRIQTLMNILYVFEMKDNLLFIITFDKKNYEIRFENLNMKII